MANAFLASERYPSIGYIDCDYGEEAYFFGVDNYGAGLELGKALESFIEERFSGKVDYIVATWNSQSGDTVKQRCTGAIDELQEKYGVKDENIVWLDSMGDDTKTQTMTSDWLGSNPEAQNIVFIGQNDDRAYAMNQAIVKAERTADCLIGSHNADPSAVENFQKYMENPGETAWVTTISYNSFLYGSQIVDYAEDILSGEAKEEHSRYAEISAITTENVEEYVSQRDEVLAQYKEH